jgi:hypothetical protein
MAQRFRSRCGAVRLYHLAERIESQELWIPGKLRLPSAKRGRKQEPDSEAAGRGSLCEAYFHRYVQPMISFLREQVAGFALLAADVAR